MNQVVRRVELDLPRLQAGLTALGPFMGSYDPVAYGPDIWRQLGLSSLASVSYEQLEDALHLLGPWPGMLRCHCGWRTTELFSRLEALSRGESTIPFRRDFGG